MSGFVLIKENDPYVRVVQCGPGFLVSKISRSVAGNPSGSTARVHPALNIHAWKPCLGETRMIGPS